MSKNGILIITMAVLLAAMVSVFSIPTFWNNIDPIVTQAIHRHENVRKIVNSLKAEVKVQEGLKDMALARISELKSKLSNAAPAPENIRTITVGNLELVPKSEYVILWNDRVVCNEIIGEYEGYVKADVKSGKSKDEIIREYEDEIDSLMKDVSRLGGRWHLSIGPGVYAGPRGVGIGLNITYGWRIF